MQVRGSLAKRALDEMSQKGLIKLVSAHRSQVIYIRVTKDTDEVEQPQVEVVTKGKKGGKGKKAKAAEEAEAE